MASERAKNRYRASWDAYYKQLEKDAKKAEESVYKQAGGPVLLILPLPNNWVKCCLKNLNLDPAAKTTTTWAIPDRRRMYS
jgi:hypothetical protein